MSIGPNLRRSLRYLSGRAFGRTYSFAKARRGGAEPRLPLGNGNASKSAFNPGLDLGPYAVAKAGLIALMNQYAVEQGRGDPAECVTADPIRIGLLDPADSARHGRPAARPPISPAGTRARPPRGSMPAMRRPLFVSTLLATSAIALPTQADDTLFGRKITAAAPLSDEEVARRRQAFERSLAEDDLVLQGDQIIPGSLARGEQTTPPRALGATWDEPPHAATIFLNFFGGELSPGTNAAEMQAGCVRGGTVDYPGYRGGTALALSIIQVFETAMAPYAVRIAYDEVPPAHLPYSMVMMGGSPAVLGMPGSTLGVSCSSDCGDTWWRDTTFAFTESSSSALEMGNTALQEAAHAFGLDHIDGSEHVMYPLSTPGEKVWATECTPYNDSTGGISCKYIHDVFCGEDGGMQNDDAELMAFFGPNVPDIEAPVVNLVEPADGIEVPLNAEGPEVTVVAEVSDNVEGAGWRLRIQNAAGDEQILNAYQRQLSWPLELPADIYTISVEAIDHDGNEGSDVATVYVGVPAPAPGEGTGSGEGGSSGDDGEPGDGTGASDSDPGVDGSGGGGGGSRGCVIAQRDEDPSWALAWLALPLLGVGRRRSRA